MRTHRLAVTVMCVGYFLVLLDVTIVNVALPSIGADLRTGVGVLQWTVDAYAVALAGLMLIAGTLGDLYGHKRIVLAGLALFGAGSAGCALAPAAGFLVAFRALSGVGAALLLPGTLAIIARAVPDRRGQARAIGVWAGVGSAALPAGPVIGGALVDGPGWRWVFWVNVPIVLVSGLVAARVVTESREPGRRRPDVPGMVLGALTLAAIVYAFVDRNLVAAGVAVVAAVLLVLAERRSPDPMLPLPLLREREFAVANAAAGAMNLGTLGLLFVVTLFLQRVQGRSALAAGLTLLPLFTPLTVLAPVAGRLTARVGPRRPMVAGLLVAAAGVALLTVVRPDSTYPMVASGLLLWGVGLGLLTPAVVAAAVRAAPTDRAGLASAANNTARQAGGAVGIAAFGALAGDPAGHRFVGGLHAAAGLTAALFVAAAILVLLTIDRSPTAPGRPAEAEPGQPAETEPRRPAETEPGQPAETEPRRPAETEPGDAASARPAGGAAPEPHRGEYSPGPRRLR